MHVCTLNVIPWKSYCYSVYNICLLAMSRGIYWISSNTFTTLYLSSWWWWIVSGCRWECELLYCAVNYMNISNEMSIRVLPRLCWSNILPHLFNCSILLWLQGNFREDNFQKSMAVIQEGPGSGQQKGRKGGTKGNEWRHFSIFSVGRIISSFYKYVFLLVAQFQFVFLELQSLLHIS